MGRNSTFVMTKLIAWGFVLMAGGSAQAEPLAPAMPPAPVPSGSVVNVGVSNSAPAARIQYSKSSDGRYIYIRSATRLELFNPDQAKALNVAFARIKEQIADLKSKSPRVGNTGKIDASVIAQAATFDRNLDGIVSYMQKYYGELDSLRKYANLATPTAMLAFLGTNWSKTPGWSPIKVAGGGSVVMAVVVLPQNVRRVEVDTGHVEEYIEFDTAIVFWPSGNLGLALAPGSQTADAAGQSATGLLSRRPLYGLGLIWGRLDRASDFHGMITGVSASVSFIKSGTVKLQALTNWSRKQAFSNVFLTAAVESGELSSFKIHASLGYIVDAAGFLGASSTKAGSPEEVLAAAAARAIERETATAILSGGLVTTPPGAPQLLPAPTPGKTPTPLDFEKNDK